MKRQWAPVRSFGDLLTDEQALANDVIIAVEGAGGGERLRLVRGPVQYDGKPLETTRASQASEHIETLLMDLGAQWDQIEQSNANGAIA